MAAIIPYLVVLFVIALFFVVLYTFFFGLPFRKHNGRTAKARSRSSAGKKKRSPAVPSPQPVKSKASVPEETQIISASELKKAAAKAPDATMEATKVFTRADFEKKEASKPAVSQKSPFGAERKPEILSDVTDIDTLEEHFVRHFLNQYGAVSKTVEQDTIRVTHHLIQQLNLPAKEASDTLMHIMVQEALQNAQRTYVLMPTALVLEMAADAFYDVARGRRSDTKTILAYDALKAMPRMEENEFNALALLLIFHYSRNTDNVDGEALKKYTQKYVNPFLNNLPDDYSSYQQLEYLQCISLENRDMPFGQILHDSYPLVFSYRGFMKTELLSLWKDWPHGSIVPSLYNSYYKFACVDDSLMPQFFANAGIEDGSVQQKLIALAHSRPVDYDRKELAYIFGKISPGLVKMQEEWDTSLLRRSSLTLMGMYIGRICIREMIGEDFDLSHWM